MPKSMLLKIIGKLTKLKRDGMKIAKKTKIFIIAALAVIISGCGTYFLLTKNAHKETSTTSLQDKNNQQLQLRILSGMVYRHLIGYNLVCKEVDVELKKYPDYFSQKYKTAIQTIDNAWKENYSTLENVLIHFDTKIYKTISEDIKKELIDLERLTAKIVLAQEKNVSVDEIQWTAELEKKLNLKDACHLLDEEAAFFLDNSTFDREFNSRVSELSK